MKSLQPNPKCLDCLMSLAKDMVMSVAAEHPDIVEQLEQVAEAARQDLGDRLTNRRGANIRPSGRVRE